MRYSGWNLHLHSVDHLSHRNIYQHYYGRRNIFFMELLLKN